MLCSHIGCISYPVHFVHGFLEIVNNMLDLYDVLQYRVQVTLRYHLVLSYKCKYVCWYIKTWGMLCSPCFVLFILNWFIKVKHVFCIPCIWESTLSVWYWPGWQPYIHVKCRYKMFMFFPAGFKCLKWSPLRCRSAVKIFYG